MIRNLKFHARVALACVLVGTTMLAQAQRAPTVTFGVTGSSGNWTLDFNVQNNFNSGEGSFYFFGVLVDTGRNIVGSPGNWNPNQWPTWNNSGFGGSNTDYNNNWIGGPQIDPGTSLNGFQVLDTATNAPTAVQFFAYALGGTYQGNDNFNNQTNPGFEGRGLAVPEPASFIAMGLGACLLLRRRRRA